MTDPVLPFLAMILAALLVLAAATSLVPRAMRQAAGLAAGLSGLGCVLSTVFLVLRGTPTGLALPLGPPGLPLQLALDQLSAFFLLLVFLAGTVAIAFGVETRSAEPGTAVTGPVIGLAGLVLALLAADGAGIVLGLSLTGAGLWANARPGAPRSAMLAVALLAGFACLIALMLPAVETGARFAAVRAATRSTVPSSGSAALYLGLALIGPGALAGLAPFHAWLVPAHKAGPPPATALLAGAVGPAAVYLLLRLLIDLGGTSPPLWWGYVTLLLAAASLLLGGWRGATGPDVATVLAAGTHRQAGLAAAGIGLALLARSADLPDTAATALAAVLLLVTAQTLGTTCSVLAAGTLEQEAGSGRLDRLGGLIHRMPVIAVIVCCGIFSLSVLPPSSGFAAFWLLFHALLAAPRIGGTGGHLVTVLIVGVLALSGALATAGGIRLIALVFLGRARTPRGAAANDVPIRIRMPLLALTGTALLLGFMPGPALRLFADPAIRLLAEEGLRGRAGILALTPASGAPGYDVLPLAALWVLFLFAILAVLRRIGSASQRTVPAWNDGFAPPPPWLPFGDPLTQADGAGFVAPIPLHHGCITEIQERIPRPSPAGIARALGRLRPALGGPRLLLALIVILLAVSAWIVPGGAVP
ncbi:MAG TPA: proton-conducting transporter membrane subunit [Acetobacteraceae bacterium]|nr:proton-conducting transporter membrane subunit [Acetobacteraceae bacterium]